MNPIRPFAVMRLTHDALRVGLSEIEAALPRLATDGLGPLLSALEPLRATLDLHRRQEDERFFPILNRVSGGAVAQAAIPDEHTHDVEDLGAIDAILAGYAPDRAPELTARLRAWIADMEAHLVHEETVMMPLTQRTAETPEGRAAVVREVVSVDLDGFVEVQIPYVVERLALSPFAPKLPMFLRALTAVLREDELARAGVSVRDAVEGPVVSCSYDPRRAA